MAGSPYDAQDQATTTKDTGFTKESFAKGLLRYCLMRRDAELGRVLDAKQKAQLNGIEGMIAGRIGEVALAQLFEEIIGQAADYTVQPTLPIIDALGSADIEISFGKTKLIALGLKATPKHTAPESTVARITDYFQVSAKDSDCLVLSLAAQYRVLGGNRILEEIYKYVVSDLQLQVTGRNIILAAQENFRAIMHNDPSAISVLTNTFKSYLYQRYGLDEEIINQFTTRFVANTALDQKLSNTEGLSLETFISSIQDDLNDIEEDLRIEFNIPSVAELKDLQETLPQFWTEARQNPELYAEAWNELAAVYKRLVVILNEGLPDLSKNLRRKMTQDMISKATQGVTILSDRIKALIEEVQPEEALRIMRKRDK